MAMNILVSYDGSEGAPRQPAVISGCVPNEEFYTAQAEIGGVVADYVALSAAAAAVAKVRPRLDDSEVHLGVGDWLSGKGASLPTATERARGALDFIYRRYLGTVGLYELDATMAFLAGARLRCAEGGGAIALGTEYEEGESLLGQAPVLRYLPPTEREKLIEELFSSDVTLSSPVKTASPANAKDGPPETGKLIRPEQAEKLTFGIRDARTDDIPAMIEIDMNSFDKVYRGRNLTPEELRADLTDKFLNRYRLLGGKWMPVLTTKDANGQDKVVGFITGCPTAKPPEAFESWEKTTDNGTLNSLYDRDGKYLYVVTLSVDPSVQGEHAHDQLYMRLMGRMIERGIDLAYFESRMPGLHTWVKYKYCRRNAVNFDSVASDPERMMAVAKEYANLTKIDKDGREVPSDRLLKIYSTDFGCKIDRVVANAYDDKPSMNFGALYTFNNPLSSGYRNPITGWLVGKSLGAAAKSTVFSKKVMKKLQKVLG